MTKYILDASQLSGNCEAQLKAKTGKIRDNHLGFLTAHKMLKKFLTCDRMIKKEVRQAKFTREELAEKLSVDLLELEAFIKPATCRDKDRRITGVVVSSLVRLYCSTKWAEL